MEQTDQPTIRQLKRQLRRDILARRSQLGDQERARRTQQATEALIATPLWQSARSIALFHSMSTEIGTRALLDDAWQSGRTVALPITPPLGRPLSFRQVDRESPMVKSHYGALEPEPSARVVEVWELDLLIVPGLSFDERGVRLGYGGGYYDRTLVGTGPAIMFCFSCQQLDQVPEEPHDRRVQGVVTDSGWRSLS